MASAHLFLDLDPVPVGALSPRDAITLSYSESDPHALHLEVEGTSWVVERSMVGEALRSARGVGACHLYPFTLTGVPHLGVVLAGPTSFSFALPSSAVASFLDQTLAFVPAGQEWRFANVDAFLGDLLNEGGDVVPD